MTRRRRQRAHTEVANPDRPEGVRAPRGGEPPTVAERVADAAARYGVRIALHEIRDGVTRVVTYAELGRRVRDLAAELDRASVPVGAAVLVVGQGPEAIVAELGVVAAGRVAVPLADLRPDGLAGLAQRGITPAAVAAPPGQAGLDLPDVADLPRLPLTVAPPPRRRRLRLTRPDTRTAQRHNPHDPALVLPAATFTQGQLAAGLAALDDLLPVTPGHRHVTHLPENPAASRAFIWHALTHGAEHCHVSDLRELAATAPAVLIVDAAQVPSAVAIGGDDAEPSGLPSRTGASVDSPATPGRPRTGVGRLLARARRRARAAGRAVQRARAVGARVPILTQAGHGVLEATLLAPARAALGRAEVTIACGPAALPLEVLDEFFAAGRPIYQAWTPPEAFGPVTCNTPTRLRFGTLGTPLEGLEVTTGSGQNDVGAVVARGPWLSEPVGLPGTQDADGYLVPTYLTSEASSLADADDEWAVSRFLVRQQLGQVAYVSHAQARARLGLDGV